MVDEGKLDRDIGENPCFAGIYDLNGSRKPNKMGKDLQTFQTASLNIHKGPAVLATVGGVKIISTAQKYDGIPTSTYCDTSDSDSDNWTVKSEYTKYGITRCCTSSDCTSTVSGKGDRWAAAMIACQDMGGHLPTMEELAKIASELYGVTIGATETKSANLVKSKMPTVLSGMSSSWYGLWSSSEYSANNAYYRAFYSSGTSRYDDTRHFSNIRAVCVGD